jgi:hypothetical protein
MLLTRSVAVTFQSLERRALVAPFAFLRQNDCVVAEYEVVGAQFM